MKLEVALRRVGAELISEESLGEETHRFMVRAGTTPEHIAAWRDGVTEYLLHAHELTKQGAPPWTVDLSRSYFVVGGAKVKYAWRIIISGDVEAGTVSLANAIIRGQGPSVELSSFPIVGKMDLDADPAKGRLKGAHPLDSADSIIAREFSH